MFTGQGHEEEKKLEKSFDKNKEKEKKDIWFVLVHMNAILCKVNFDIDWGK